jgi:capsule polysaccharide export protein KpsE/RkpR
MEPTKSEGRHATRDPEFRSLVSRWRARAQEILAQAETMSDAEARQTMREIAAKYERLALQVEQQTSGADRA